MKKLILPIFLILVIIMMGFVAACISFPQIETKNNCNIKFESFNYNNESAILEVLNSRKNECNLNDESIIVLKDFVLNGYSVKEQTQGEYNAFLKEAEKQNEKKGCVDYYSAIYHNLSWTGYISSLRTEDESGNYCPVPNCMGAVISIIWNDLDSSSDCKNLYWFDNENKNCEQKKFCGTYMYQGLQTFESKTQCEKALKPSENKTFHLSNGRNAEIKILPETASLRARERLGELGFNVTLKEVGKGNETKPVYEVSGEKEGKMFGLFKVKGKVSAEVDAETGEVIKIKKPWWSFLASGI